MHDATNDSAAAKLAHAQLSHEPQRGPRFVHLWLAVLIVSLALCNACGANTIRAYDPKTGAFSSKLGELVCTKPSVSSWEESATDYQRAVRASIQALRQEFTDCYVSQLRKDTSTTGTSCVRFVAGSDGRVNHVEIDSTTLPEALQDCVLVSGSRARVPPPRKSPLVVMLPLKFVPKK